MNRRWPGLVAAGLICVTVGGALAALTVAAPHTQSGSLWRDAYLRHVVWFTFWQALLSTGLSISLGLAVARALARRRFGGRRLLLRLFGLPLVMPNIVAVFGIVTVYGHAGWLNTLAVLSGLPSGRFLYGLPGILIAHVFFNLPLAVRLLLPAWDTVPGEVWRLASQLGMPSGALFRLVEWPALRAVLPGVAGLVFMLCFTSFAVILVLGGGPAATTIEVAIYQALRFDFDLSRAVQLALLQLAVCVTLVAGFGAFTRTLRSEATPGRGHPRPDTGSIGGRVGDALLLAAAGALVLLPLAAVVSAGLAGPVATVLAEPALWSAVLHSLGVASAASVLAVTLAAALMVTSRDWRLRRHRPRSAAALEVIASAVLAAPPIVLGAGFFVLLSPWLDLFSSAGLGLVVVVNALMALPYATRVLGPPMHAVVVHHDRLCASLGIVGWDRLRRVEWPLLRRPLGLALGLAAALSTGDLGVIALFGAEHTATVPWLLYQRLAAYRLGDAAVIALVLVIMSFAIFVAGDRLVGGRRRA